MKTIGQTGKFEKLFLKHATLSIFICVSLFVFRRMSRASHLAGIRGFARRVPDWICHQVESHQLFLENSHQLQLENSQATPPNQKPLTQATSPREPAYSIFSSFKSEIQVFESQNHIFKSCKIFEPYAGVDRTPFSHYSPVSIRRWLHTLQPVGDLHKGRRGFQRERKRRRRALMTWSHFRSDILLITRPGKTTGQWGERGIWWQALILLLIWYGLRRRRVKIELNGISR